jgi:hypothetical protein
MPPGYYTVAGVAVGPDLVASFYAQGADMFVGSVSILCSKSGPAHAVIGTPIVALYAMDGTRSGGLDTSEYRPPRRVPAGQPFSIIWSGVGAPNTASMTIQVVDPQGQGS